jgi:antitoxin component YwqK of YwqJK toxin-antitoxin module
VQPTSHDVALPDPSLADPPLPDGLPTTPPAHQWWTKRGACPKGTHHVAKRVPVDYPKGTSVETHECVGKGPWPRPKSGGSIDAKSGAMLDGPLRMWGDYWVDADGKTTGAFEELLGHGQDHVGFMVHGVQQGRQQEVRDGKVVSFETYVDGKRHGLVYEADNSMPWTGYEGEHGREGTWLWWRSSDGAVKARLRYQHGALDGAQRWWFADGKVLARGRFAAGKGDWEILGRDGKRRSVTRCDGRRLIDATAWDGAGKVVVRACGPAAAAGCAPLGPKDAAAQRALGADADLCDNQFDVPPLSTFD